MVTGAVQMVKEVEAFVEKTGVDRLASSIGTSHGTHEFMVKPGE